LCAPAAPLSERALPPWSPRARRESKSPPRPAEERPSHAGVGATSRRCLLRASCAPVTTRPERFRAGWSGSVFAWLLGFGSTMRPLARFPS
jgi:hypothetical protein